MRIVLAGSGRLASGMFRALRESDHKVVGVVLNGRITKNGPARFYKSVSSQLPMLARTSNVPIHWIDRMGEEELAPIRALEPDLLLVGGFGIILKPPLLSLPRIGCVNVHSSLLPKHRGPNPFTAVVLAGERESGVTFHIMEPGIDTGDILDQTPYDVDEGATMVSVYFRACDIAEARVVTVIDEIEKNGLKGTPQDESQATYDKKTSHEEAHIDWSQPASDIDRMVRGMALPEPAYFLYRGAGIQVYRVSFDNKPVDVTPGTLISVKPDVVVAANPGTVTICSAATARLGMRWPLIWARPAVGDVLD